MSVKINIKSEQRAAIRFCVRLNKSGAETVLMLKQAYKEECLCRSAILRWHNLFKAGRESFELIPHGGHPTTVRTEVNINTVSAIIQEDSHLSTRKIASLLNISKSSVSLILKDSLQMRRVSSTWVPHFLTRKQMQNRVKVCQEVLAVIEEQPDFLDRVITVDESWVHYYDPLTKQESSHWNTAGAPRKKKVRQQKSAGKVLMFIFFDSRGPVYQHAVPPKTKINAEYYKSVLEKLLRHIRTKRPELKGTWVLHHNNARPHVAKVVQDWLVNKGVRVMPHPPYSPDLAPCDFWLFPQLKKSLRGQQFCSDDEVVNTVHAFVNSVPQAEFQKTIKSKWIERMQQCIRVEGRYFEKKILVIMSRINKF